MSHASLSALRQTIDAQKYADEAKVLPVLMQETGLSSEDRNRISARAAGLVRDIRGSAQPGLMEVFLAEYGLSTDEGVALMCLAEALLRVPDADTIDALIEDKIAPSNWGKHLGASSSSLVNASTWALMLTGKVLEEKSNGLAGHLRGAVKRLGEPVIRTAVSRAMKEMGRQFVLGEDIQAAMKRAKELEAQGYSYSYDMLGEAARTEADAKRYHLSYSRAISAIATACTHDNIRTNPGISVKLSALHPRYEEAKLERVMTELVPRVRSLALIAKSAGMGFNIDAEEADRLSLSLDVIEAVLEAPGLEGWDGFGVVVQAYGQRCGATIDWLATLCERLNRRIMVRLVKGAYWDTEIKHAQEIGAPGFPVYTRKASTDLSYIANARKLLSRTDVIYPQFATHNAHTAAAILDIAKSENCTTDDYEFQRLHGMGERLHDIVLEAEKTGCRIYAPVGEHRDLLAYLVRRLLENGANSSFVNQIVDEDVTPEEVASDPLSEVETYITAPLSTALKTPDALFGDRANSRGWDIAHAPELNALDQQREKFRKHRWTGTPLLATDTNAEAPKPVLNPANNDDVPGMISAASDEDVTTAIDAATPWNETPGQRAKILHKAADLYEAHHAELFALLTREAGKTLPDAISELREAVDFLRFYADEAAKRTGNAAGVFTCISPWNFPLAIFSGQVAAALAAGNAVLAKPADQTPLVAFRAVQLLHEAGVPRAAMQYIPGPGSRVGAALTSNPKVDGVCFTGSTATALRIRRTMAENLAPNAPFIAETGGLNAMIVDSTALPEQAVQAVIESAFQSAGQRCSALRCLYIQEDIADGFLKMLHGAMDELAPGDPWNITTDTGPVIDEAARKSIADYVTDARDNGHILHELKTHDSGNFIAPTVLSVNGIAEMTREIFGPILHVARFKSIELDQVIDDINATGYGLTFGLHTRIDDRVQHVVERIHAGNVYVNRNQIGAIVGSQPFGGEGLSGTGPKAGGPMYLNRFYATDTQFTDAASAEKTDISDLQAALQTQTRMSTDAKDSTALPGPTGESNQLSTHVREPLLCMGPGFEAAQQQLDAVQAAKGRGVIAHGLSPLELQELPGISGAIFWGDEATARTYATALSLREGAILPLICEIPDESRTLLERHLCIDTTAAGGNAALLAEAGDS